MKNLKKRAQEPGFYAFLNDLVKGANNKGVLVKSAVNREPNASEIILGEWVLLAAEKAYLEFLAEKNNGLNASQGARYLQLDEAAQRKEDLLRLLHEGDRKVIVAEKVVGIKADALGDVVTRIQEWWENCSAVRKGAYAVAGIGAVLAGCVSTPYMPSTEVFVPETQPRTAEVTDLPQPGVTLIKPTAAFTETRPLDTPTPSVVSGSMDTTFLAVPDVPEGFGGSGELISFKNEKSIQDGLNKKGYAPIIDEQGNLSQIQTQDGSRVCIANLPPKIYNPNTLSGEDNKIKSEQGIISYGDEESKEVHLKAVGAVSLNGFPEGWSCLNAVVINKDNPAGLGAVRMLLVDEQGNIMGEMPAAFSTDDQVELRWEEGGPKLYINGELREFELTPEAQSAIFPPDLEGKVSLSDLPPDFQTLQTSFEKNGLSTAWVEEDNGKLVLNVFDSKSWIEVAEGDIETQKLNITTAKNEPVSFAADSFEVQDGKIVIVDRQGMFVPQGQKLLEFDGKEWVADKLLYLKAGPGAYRFFDIEQGIYSGLPLDIEGNGLPIAAGNENFFGQGSIIALLQDEDTLGFYTVEGVYYTIKMELYDPGGGVVYCELIPQGSRCRALNEEGARNKLTEFKNVFDQGNKKRQLEFDVLIDPFSQEIINAIFEGRVPNIPRDYKLKITGVKQL